MNDDYALSGRPSDGGRRLTPLPVIRERTAAALHDIANVLCGMLVSAEIAVDVVRALPFDEMASVLESGERPETQLARLKELIGSARSDLDLLVVESEAILDHVHHVEQLVVRHRRALETGQSWCAADELVEAALHSQMGRINEHAIPIDRSYAPDAISFVDRHRIVRVLVNLISNAVDATISAGTRGAIEVRTSVADGQLRFDVRDHGPGFEASAVPKMFTPGHSTKGVGRGLGLPWSQNIARDLGGSVEAHSEGAGRGATFTLLVPQGEKGQSDDQ